MLQQTVTILLILLSVTTTFGSGSPRTPHNIVSKRLRPWLSTFSVIALSTPSVVYGRQGAFEQDVELYLQNIINGNSGKQNAGRKTPLPSPRKLDLLFAGRLLDAVDSRICEISGSDSTEIKSFVRDNLPTYLNKFKEFAPIAADTLSDQYYFDLSLFLHYLFAKNAISDSKSRVLLRERVADDILRLLDLDTPPKSNQYTELGSGIKTILDKLCGVGLIESYSVDLEDLMDIEYLQQTFSKAS